LFISNGFLVPPIKEYGLDTIHYAFLSGKIVNCMRPEVGDKVYDGMGAIHDATV
jgi:hypothetical protein